MTFRTASPRPSLAELQAQQMARNPKPKSASRSQPAAQSGGFSAYRPGQAQSQQSPYAAATQYGGPALQMQQYGQASAPLPTFQFRGTDFMGNTYDNPAAMTAQQGAMAQALNQQRAQQVSNLGAPLMPLNPFAAYQQGLQMTQGGWQNPFAMQPQALPALQQRSFPPQYQQAVEPPRGGRTFNPPGAGGTGGSFRDRVRANRAAAQGSHPPQSPQDLFAQFNFTPPAGFIDALLQRLRTG